MKLLGFAVCAVLIAAGAGVHGAATHRWSAFAPPAGQAEKLHAAPLQLGDYAADDVPSDLPIKEKSRVTCRRYYSPTTGVTGVISVITGPPGAVSTHTPDVCYPSSGYKTLRGPTRETLDLPGGGTVRYFVADFEKKTATNVERHRVRWAWAPAGGTFDAPDRARFAYLREPELYKTYVVTGIPATDPGEKAPPDEPAVRAFVAAAFAHYGAAAGGR